VRRAVPAGPAVFGWSSPHADRGRGSPRARGAGRYRRIRVAVVADRRADRQNPAPSTVTFRGCVPTGLGNVEKLRGLAGTRVE